MKYVRMPVTLTLTGPILTQSSAAGEPGIDSTIARNETGQAMLPFSLVKGRVLQSWRDLSGADDYEEWFGGEAESDRSPNRARFRFSDFVAGEGNRDGIKHRIRIDRRTGTAADGDLQFIESPFAPGEPVVFRGEVAWFSGDDVSDDAAAARKLEDAFRWTNNFGAERTTGFGRVAGVAIGDLVKQSLDDATPAAGIVPEILSLQIEMVEPFCIARRRVAKNLFESEEIISGSVIRGVLATLFNQSLGGRRGSAPIDGTVPRWTTLGKWFNSIRLTAASPVAHGVTKRPVTAPLSLVKDQDDKWHDVALCAAPIIFSSEADGKQQFRAPSFAIDWKQQADVEAAFGWIGEDGKATSPRREVRVRTAIDADTRRAKDEQLFAYEMVIPAGFQWHGTVDLAKVGAEDRPQLLTELNALLSIGRAENNSSGVQGFGKSKARGRVTVSGSILPEHVPSFLTPIEKDLWIITLQAPALLCDSGKLSETSGATQLRAAYAAVFKQLSAEKLELVRYFARQSLAGGEYLHKRFQGDKPYAAFLLTDRGSVFVLRQTEDATALLARWLEHGLPLPKWAQDRYGGDWMTNPFLPIDGFGTIAVNLPCHTANRPIPGTFIELAAAKGGA